MSPRLLAKDRAKDTWNCLASSLSLCPGEVVRDVDDNQRVQRDVQCAADCLRHAGRRFHRAAPRRVSAALGRGGVHVAQVLYYPVPQVATSCRT
eukprot:1680516-Pleurochrysis_carterae.AAC.2